VCVCVIDDQMTPNGDRPVHDSVSGRLSIVENDTQSGCFGKQGEEKTSSAFSSPPWNPLTCGTPRDAPGGTGGQRGARGADLGPILVFRF